MKNEIIINKLKQYGDVDCDVALSKHTTFRIGGICDYMVYPKNEICLTSILKICKEYEIPYKILGKGSNLLASDAAYHGAIISLDRFFTEFYFEEDGTCVAQSGTSIILLAHEAMKRSLSGLEFASGIPGTVGGALFMNAGAYRSDMAAILKEAYVLRDDECVWVSAVDLELSYRHSIFQRERDWIILGGKFQLTLGDQIEIKELVDARRKRRMDSQPLNYPCAGSVFRNPDDVPAWKLIEDIGLRGKQIGGAMISCKHANFIVNVGGATASDVMALIELVQKEIRDKYHIELKLEVEKFNWPD
ncbi:MAG: UDP-N-acetylmuramate dehydrogenase [Erysipelotrichaceae bacterium]